MLLSRLFVPAFLLFLLCGPLLVAQTDFQRFLAKFPAAGPDSIAFGETGYGSYTGRVKAISGREFYRFILKPLADRFHEKGYTINARFECNCPEREGGLFVMAAAFKNFPDGSPTEVAGWCPSGENMSEHCNFYAPKVLRRYSLPAKQSLCLLAYEEQMCVGRSVLAVVFDSLAQPIAARTFGIYISGQCDYRLEGRLIFDPLKREFRHRTQGWGFGGITFAGTEASYDEAFTSCYLYPDGNFSDRKVEVRSFQGFFLDSNSGEALYLDDGQSVVAVGYKSNVPSSEWLFQNQHKENFWMRPPVLKFDRKSRKIVIRFSNSPTTYTLTLSPDGESLSSKGSDGSAEQVFKQIRFQMT